MRRVAWTAFVGLGAGLVFALVQLYVVELFERVRMISLVFDGMNAPALWLSELWTHTLRLPPRGEVAWVVVPAVCIWVQWSIIALAGACCWRPRRQAAERPGFDVVK